MVRIVQIILVIQGTEAIGINEFKLFINIRFKSISTPRFLRLVILIKVNKSQIKNQQYLVPCSVLEDDHRLNNGVDYFVNPRDRSSYGDDRPPALSAEVGERPVENASANYS